MRNAQGHGGSSSNRSSQAIAWREGGPIEPWRAGFTLVELLVVIGIIALLISILLPALSAARREAMQVKCASNLRECGAALQLYAAAYKGYGVPVRCGGGAPANEEINQSVSAPYELNGVLYGAASNSTTTNPIQNTNAAYWPEFLAPFISSSKGGHADTQVWGNLAGLTAQQQAMSLAAARKAVFWCPSWNAPDSMVAASPNYTGYCMNYMVSISTTIPAFNSDATPANGIPASAYFNIDLDASGKIVTTGGTWYQLSQIKHSDQRCFLADAVYNQLVCWQTPSQGIPNALLKGAVSPPPQNILTYAGGEPMYTSGSASSGIHGQNAFDCYRHGVYPQPIKWTGSQGSGGPVYSPNSGKVAYNILYFDGHVSQSADRAESYRSVRMRYPG